MTPVTSPVALLSGVVTRAVDDVSSAHEGGRNHALYAAAANVVGTHKGLTNAGASDLPPLVSLLDDLLRAAESAGLDHKEAQNTIRSAETHAQPEHFMLNDTARSRRKATEAKKAERLPPRAEVQALWDAASAPDDEVVAWLRRRLGKTADAAASLVRALPADGLPSWARVGKASWSKGHRALFPVYSAGGELVALRARWVPEHVPEWASGIKASPGTGNAAGPGLMANAAALDMLKGQTRPATVIVCEGEPDWLAWSAAMPDAAVLGLWQGAWSLAHAERIPATSLVVVATDNDAAGDKYAQQVFADVRVAKKFRWRSDRDAAALTLAGEPLSLDDLEDHSTVTVLPGGSGDDLGLFRTGGEVPRVIPSVANMLKILGKADGFAGRAWYCEFSQRVMLDDQPVTDEAETGLMSEIADAFDIPRLATSAVSEALRKVARTNTRHPVRQYLESLKWDGCARLDTFFIDHMGAEESVYTRAATACFGIMCVARILAPGCKVDTIPILVGAQGARKSTALAALAGEDWFADTVFDITSKDAMLMLNGVWIYELGELQAIKGKRAEAVKGFVTSRKDHYRPPFGRNPVNVPRQTVFVGTTNDEEFLNDPTGNRRFWPIRVQHVDIKGITDNRDQFWAEAVHRYRAGESWWLSEHVEAERAAVAAVFEEVDAWEDKVAAWALARALPFSVADVLADCLDIPAERHDRASAMRVARVLKRAGLQKLKRSRTTGRATMWGRP